jgi:hypothetical protein
MKSEFKDFYQEMFSFFHSFHNSVAALKDRMKTNNDMEDQTDLAYVVREILALSEDVRKELEKLQKQAHLIACLQWIKAVSDGEMRTDKISTEYVTGVPNVKEGASLPKLKTEPEQYRKMMEFFGVKPEFVDKDILRVHWPRFMELMNEMTAAGKPYPPGIDAKKTFPMYELSLRKKKAILEDDAPF